MKEEPHRQAGMGGWKNGNAATAIVHKVVTNH